MTLKQYTSARIAIVITLAMFVSVSVTARNYILPLVAAAAALLLLFLRSKVADVIADERDYAIAGKAARWAMQIYAWAAVAGFFLLYALKGNDPVWAAVAYTLSYSACFILLAYSVIFRIFFGPANVKKSWLVQAFGIAIIIALAIAGYVAIEQGIDSGIQNTNNEIAK